MLKRIIAIAVAVFIVMSMAAIAVSAAEVNDSAVGGTSSSELGASNLIYFDASGWKSFSKVYCHIWEVGGDNFYGWQTPSEACTSVGGTKYSYDLSKLKDSINIPGGMKSGGKYCVNFVTDKGVQTFDLTIGTDCAGDTAYLKGNLLENPIDSEGTAEEAAWEKHSGKYAAHLTFTSIGNVVGSKLAPGETGVQVIGDWTPRYLRSQSVNAVNALKNALPKFGINSDDAITSVYAYIIKQSKSGKVDKADLEDIKKTLNKAFLAVYPSMHGIDEEEAEDESDQDVEKIIKKGQQQSQQSQEGTPIDSEYTGDYSGSAADGQETTILFVLAGVMTAAAGAMFVFRKKREE